MSYTVNKENFGDLYELGWRNLTAEYILDDDEFLISTFEREWEAIDDEYTRLVLDDEKVSFIHGSGYVEEWKDSREPMMNYLHVVSNSYSRHDSVIKDLIENASTITVLEDPFGTTYIALSGGGMDFSQQIAYAYWKLCKVIPACFYSILNEKPFTLSEGCLEGLKDAIRIQINTHYKSAFPGQVANTNSNKIPPSNAEVGRRSPFA